MNRRRLAVAVAVLVALGLAGSIAYAAIPDAAGTIHGCYAKNGNLRVIDPADPKQNTCKPDETALDWSQTGPAGATGASRPTGCDRGHRPERRDRRDRSDGSHRGGRRDRRNRSGGSDWPERRDRSNRRNRSRPGQAEQPGQRVRWTRHKSSRNPSMCRRMWSAPRSTRMRYARPG